MTAYKPEGYTSVAPYLIVDDPRATIAFLVAVFDAEPLRMVERENGRLAHGEVRVDDTVLMLGGAMAGWPAVPSHVHLYVRDVDATFQRALAQGATSVQAPMQKDDADKRGGFTEASGTTWWVAQQLG